MQLTGQRLANTQVACGQRFVSKNHDGRGGNRERRNEVLFIDGGDVGLLMPGSRKQKHLADEEIERVATVYREHEREARPSDQPGFAKVATLDEVRPHSYAPTAGRYVGSAETGDEDEMFEEKLPRLFATLLGQQAEAAKVSAAIAANPREFGNGG